MYVYVYISIYLYIYISISIYRYIDIQIYIEMKLSMLEALSNVEIASHILGEQRGSAVHPLDARCALAPFRHMCVCVCVCR